MPLQAAHVWGERVAAGSSYPELRRVKLPVTARSMGHVEKCLTAKR